MEENNRIKYIRPIRHKKIKREIPPECNSISDLIKMAQTGKRYANIDNEMLWSISAQLIELDELIGMEALKKSLFYHIIYYLLDLFINDENDYLHTVIMGPPGCGKCLGKNEMVYLYDGTLKPVQDITTDDTLIGDDCTPRRVQSICHGIGELYEITMNGTLESYIVNDSHVLSLVNKTNDEKIDMGIQDYLKLSDIEQSMYLGYKCPIIFENNLIIDSYLQAYLLVNNNNTDLSHMDKSGNLYKYLRQFMGIHPSYRYNHIDEFYVQCYNTDDLHFENIEHSFLESFLSGIVDNCGSMKGGTFIINTTDETLHIYNIITNICNILGIPYNATLNKTSITLNDAIITHNLIQLTIKNIYSYIGSLKHDTMPTATPPLNTYSITIKPKERGEYFGFELDGNGRFMLKNGIITHNTTIARIIGEMYKNMKVLSQDGVFKIAKREDLIAEYLGQTAIKTKKLLESCKGGVLFIDEIYALGPGEKDKDSFSKEAIDTLNVFLSENSNNFCCIVAGYEEDIKTCFFSVNQGLQRRFQWVHRIENYTNEQMGDMFIKILYDIQWRKDVSLTKADIVKVISDNSHLFKSFGGDIENFITKCKMAHAKRIISLVSPKKNILILDDLKVAIELMKPNSLHEEKDDSYVHTMYI